MHDSAHCSPVSHSLIFSPDIPFFSLASNRFHPKKMPRTILYSQMNSKEVKVQDLGESLGFRNGTERPLHTLTVTTHEWRKKWIGSNGKLGTDLRDRKSEEGKRELRLMTHAYLESGGRGLRLWPERPHDCPKTAPEYPRDKEK